MLKPAANGITRTQEYSHYVFLRHDSIISLAVHAF